MDRKQFSNINSEKEREILANIGNPGVLGYFVIDRKKYAGYDDGDSEDNGTDPINIGDCEDLGNEENERNSGKGNSENVGNIGKSVDLEYNGIDHWNPKKEKGNGKVRWFLGNGWFNKAKEICIDSIISNIFIVDREDDWIEIFDNTGITYIEEINLLTNLVVRIASYDSVFCVTGKGTLNNILYITDTYNYWIVAYTIVNRLDINVTGNLHVSIFDANKHVFPCNMT